MTADSIEISKNARQVGPVVPDVGYSPGQSATAAPNLVEQAGVLRSRADALGQAVAQLQEHARNHDLDQRAAIKSRGGVPSLLGELAQERGMAWADIARLIGVSVGAIRKWRTGATASAEHRLALATLAAFLDLLSEYAIDDPVQWMEMRLALPPGYVIRPLDLYANGHVWQLLEYASQRRSAHEILDAIDPNWRESRSGFEVYDARDGAKAIRMRAKGNNHG